MSGNIRFGMVNVPICAKSSKMRFLQCRHEKGSRYKLPAPGGPESGLGSVYVTSVFLDGIIICRLYKLIPSDQAQDTLQLTVFLIDVNHFSWSVHDGSPEKKFLQGPEPSLGGPALLIRHTNILIIPRWKKTSLGIGDPEASR